MDITVKEWAAGYRAWNEAKDEERRRSLPLRSPIESVASYFRLSETMVRFSPGARAAFDDERRRHHLRTWNDYQTAARRWGIGLPA